MKKITSFLIILIPLIVKSQNISEFEKEIRQKDRMLMFARKQNDSLSKVNFSLKENLKSIQASYMALEKNSNLKAEEENKLKIAFARIRELEINNSKAEERFTKISESFKEYKESPDFKKQIVRKENESLYFALKDIESMNFLFKESGLNNLSKINFIDKPIDFSNCNIPNGIKGLTSSKTFFRTKNSTELQDGQVFILSGKNKDEYTEVEYDFVRFKEKYCEVKNVGYNVIWAVGIKLKIRAKLNDNKVKLNTLYTLAAGVENKKVDVLYEIEVMGISGEKLPSFNINGDFNIETYYKITNRIDETLSRLYDPEITIDPEVLSYQKISE